MENSIPVLPAPPKPADPVEIPGDPDWVSKVGKDVWADRRLADQARAEAPEGLEGFVRTLLSPDRRLRDGTYRRETFAEQYAQRVVADAGLHLQARELLEAALAPARQKARDTDSARLAAEAGAKVEAARQAVAEVQGKVEAADAEYKAALASQDVEAMVAAKSRAATYRDVVAAQQDLVASLSAAADQADAEAERERDALLADAARQLVAEHRRRSAEALEKLGAALEQLLPAAELGGAVARAAGPHIH
jgi:hypothetical protein